MNKKNHEYPHFPENIFNMQESLTGGCSRIRHRSRGEIFSLLDLQEHMARGGNSQNPVKSEPKNFDPHKSLRDIHGDNISIFR